MSSQQTSNNSGSNPRGGRQYWTNLSSAARATAAMNAELRASGVPPSIEQQISQVHADLSRNHRDLNIPSLTDDAYRAQERRELKRKAAKSVIHLTANPQWLEGESSTSLLNRAHKLGGSLSCAQAIRISKIKPGDVIIMFKYWHESRRARNEERLIQEAFHGMVGVEPEMFYITPVIINKAKLVELSKAPGASLDFMALFENPDDLLSALCLETELDIKKIYWKGQCLILALESLGQAREAVSGKMFSVRGIHTQFISRNHRSTPLQCWRCQRLGHMSGECKEPRRCGYCLDSHLTRSCPKTKPPMCAICNGPHPSCELWKCEHPTALNAFASAKLWRGPTEWESRSSVPSPDLSEAFDNVSREELSRKVDVILGPFAHGSSDLAKAIEDIKRLLIPPRSEHSQPMKEASEVAESIESPSAHFSFEAGIPFGIGPSWPSPHMDATRISRPSAEAPEFIPSSPASTPSAPSTPKKRSRSIQDAFPDYTQHKRVRRESTIQSLEEDSRLSEFIPSSPASTPSTPQKRSRDDQDAFPDHTLSLKGCATQSPVEDSSLPAEAFEFIPSSPASSPSTPQKRSRDDQDAFPDHTLYKRMCCGTTIQSLDEDSRIAAIAPKFIPSSLTSSSSTPQKHSRNDQDAFLDHTQRSCETTTQSSGQVSEPVPEKDAQVFVEEDAQALPEEDVQPSSGQDAQGFVDEDAQVSSEQNAQSSPDKSPRAPCSLDVKQVSPPKRDRTLDTWFIVKQKMPRRPGSGSFPVNVAFKEQIQDCITCEPL
ncbi:hypothetical protein ACHAP5_009035 [Fusarium lateritium]